MGFLIFIGVLSLFSSIVSIFFLISKKTRYIAGQFMSISFTIFILAIFISNLGYGSFSFAYSLLIIISLLSSVLFFLTWTNRFTFKKINSNIFKLCLIPLSILVFILATTNLNMNNRQKPISANDTKNLSFKLEKTNYVTGDTGDVFIKVIAKGADEIDCDVIGGDYDNYAEILDPSPNNKNIFTGKISLNKPKQTKYQVSFIKDHKTLDKKTITIEPSDKFIANWKPVKLSIGKTEYSTDLHSNKIAIIKGSTESGTTLNLSNESLDIDKNIKVNSDGTFTLNIEKEDNYTLDAYKQGKEDKSITINIKRPQSVLQKINQQKKQEKIAKQQTEINEGKKNAQTITYNHLKKNADDYKGKKYFVTGKVVQAIEDSGDTLLRVNITKDEYGNYDDTVAIIIPGKTDAIEDDIIQVLGDISGNFSYKTTIGGEMTIPGIYATSENVKVIK